MRRRDFLASAAILAANPSAAQIFTGLTRTVQGWGTANKLLGGYAIPANSITPFNSFNTWVGGSGVQQMLAYANGTSWSNLLSNATLYAGVLGPSYPIHWSVAIPSDGTTTLLQVAQGMWDANLNTLAQTFLAARTGDSTIVVRPFWEFQNTAFAWTAVGHEQAYIAAFRRLVEIFLQNSTKFRFEWNANESTLVNGTYYDPSQAYPGDGFVDVIGMDFYLQPGFNAQWNGTAHIAGTTFTVDSTIAGTLGIGQFLSSVQGGTNIAAGTYVVSGSGTSWVVSVSQTVASEQMYAASPSAVWSAKVSLPFGLNWLTQFGRAHSKPVAIGEWGVGMDNMQGYVSLMAEWVQANNVAYHNYFSADNGSPNLLDNLYSGQWPATGARFQFEFATPTKTNLIASPLDFTTGSWSRGAVTITAAQPDPFGGSAAQDMFETAATASHVVSQTVSKDGNAHTYRVFWYAAPLGGRNFSQCQVGQNAFGSGTSCYYDLVNQVAGSYFSFGGMGTPIPFGFPAGAGFTKCGFEFTSTTDATLLPNFQAASADGTDSYLGVITEGNVIYDAWIRQIS